MCGDRRHARPPHCVRERPEEAASGLLEIARTAKRDADRIAAWRELLDRGYGKAPAFVSIEGQDPLELDEISAEIKSIVDQLRSPREART